MESTTVRDGVRPRVVTFTVGALLGAASVVRRIQRSARSVVHRVLVAVERHVPPLRSKTRLEGTMARRDALHGIVDSQTNLHAVRELETPRTGQANLQTALTGLRVEENHMTAVLEGEGQ